MPFLPRQRTPHRVAKKNPKIQDITQQLLAFRLDFASEGAVVGWTSHFVIATSAASAVAQNDISSPRR